MTAELRPGTAVPERIWIAIVIILSCIVLIITIWCLSQGITTIFMHLYYVPIILLAYHYRKKGLYASVLLSLSYLALIAVFEPDDLVAIEGAGIRVIIFIGVAALVAYLSEQLVHAQEALGRTAHIQQGIIQNANVWLMVLDSHGRILEWNAAAEMMSGYTAGEVMGKNEVWKQLYPDKDYRREITGKITGIITQDRYLENLRTVITGKDRTKKTILWNTRVLPHEENKPPRYIAVGVDITATEKAETELKRAYTQLTAKEEELREQYEDLARSQKAIRESEAEYKNILRTAMDGFCIVGPAGSFLDVNDSFCSMTGYTRQELLNLSLADIEVKETESDIAGHIREIIRKGADRFESQYRRLDGSIIDVEVSVVHSETHSRHFVVFVHDITNRKRAEEVLKSSDARMRAMLESIIAGVVIIDPDTHTIVDANAVAVRMIGAEKEAIIGSVCHKYICPAETGACPITDLKQVVNHSEKLLVHTDGTTSPILKSVVPVRLSDRTYLLESFIDITDIKKAESALRKSEEQFRILAEQSSDIICTIGLNESITFVSPAIKKILGYDPIEIIGKNAFDFIFYEDRQKGLEAFKSQVIEKGQVQVVTVELVRKDGGHVPVEFTLAPVIKAGVLAEVLVSGRDITERKQAEAALKESEFRFRELFNSMTSGVAVYRAVDEGDDFVFIDFNHGAELIEKIPKTEVIGKRVSKVFPGAAGFGIIDVFRRVWQTGESEHYPVSLYADERITGWRENFVYRLPSGEIVAIFDDVTERKIAEEALRESEERYRTIFRSSRDAIMTIEPPDWRFTSANPATVAMFKAKDEAELLSTWPWQVSPERQPDGRLSGEKAQEMIGKAVKDGSNFFEWTHRRLNGEDFPATVLATRFEWKGQIIVQGTVRDITDQKRAELVLQESEEQFRGVAERSSDIIMLTDLEGRATYVSPSVERILGYKTDEVVGRPPSNFVHPDDMGYVQELFQKDIAGTTSTGIEVRVRKKDGGYATLNMVGSPIIKEGGFFGIQLIGRDITETKAAEARIDELLRLQEEQVEIINTSPAVAFLWKAEENWPVETVSNNISRFGYTPDDFISGRVLFSSIIHPGDLGRVAAEVEYNSTNNIDTFYQVYRIFGKDKKEYWIEDFTKIRRDSAGTITHYQGIVLDITERKRAEMERDRLVSVIRHSNELIGLSAPDRKIIFLNDAGAEMLGLNPEDARGHDFIEFLPDNLKQDHLQSAIQPALMEQGHWEGDLQYRNQKTGKLIDVHAMTFLISDPVTGAPQFLANVSLDITERKQAEKRLRESERRLTLAIEGSDIGIWDWDIPTGKVEYNDRQVIMLGYTPDEFGHDVNRFMESIHPNDLAGFSAMLNDCITGTSSVFSSEIRIRHRNDTWVWVLARGSVAERDLNGKAARISGTHLDITERKQTELVLAASEEKFHTVADFTYDWEYWLGPDKQMVYCSPSCERITGYPPADFFADPHMFARIVHPDDLIEVEEHDRTSWKTHEPQSVDFRIIHRDGSVRWIGHVCQQVTAHDGTSLGRRINNRDITDRKKAEAELKKYSETLEEMVNERTKELREAQEQLIKKEKLAVLGKLAGGVGHELRNPLGAIKNAAYFLNMVLENPEPDVKETLEIMNKEVTRSEDILSSLLDFARPTVLTLRKVRINDVLDEAVTRNPIAENINLTRNLDETLPYIMADPDKLLQVFTNLVTNACQAMPEGGTLTLQSAVLGENRVSVSVTDTGVGISEENRKRLFEPLFSTKAKGIGLGLVVTRAIVEAHQGTIDFRSEAGKGTTFTVTLPVGIVGRTET